MVVAKSPLHSLNTVKTCNRLVSSTGQLQEPVLVCVLILVLTTLICKSWFRLPPRRTGMLVVASLAAVYFVYLCSPHGYRQLEHLESRLDQLTPQGARTENVRAGLSHEGIEYRQWVQESAAPLLSDGSGVKIAANRGEYVISSRHPTEAWPFPGGEQL